MPVLVIHSVARGETLSSSEGRERTEIEWVNRKACLKKDVLRYRESVVVWLRVATCGGGIRRPGADRPHPLLGLAGASPPSLSLRQRLPGRSLLVFARLQLRPNTLSLHAIRKRC